MTPTEYKSEHTRRVIERYRAIKASNPHLTITECGERAKAEISAEFPRPARDPKAERAELTAMYREAGGHCIFLWPTVRR